MRRRRLSFRHAPDGGLPFTVAEGRQTLAEAQDAARAHPFSPVRIVDPEAGTVVRASTKINKLRAAYRYPPGAIDKVTLGVRCALHAWYAHEQDLDVPVERRRETVSSGAVEIEAVVIDTLVVFVVHDRDEGRSSPEALGREQIDEVMQFADASARANPSIAFAGYQTGGRLANLAGARTGRDACVFDRDRHNAAETREIARAITNGTAGQLLSFRPPGEARTEFKAPEDVVPVNHSAGWAGLGSPDRDTASVLDVTRIFPEYFPGSGAAAPSEHHPLRDVATAIFEVAVFGGLRRVQHPDEANIARRSSSADLEGTETGIDRPAGILDCLDASSSDCLLEFAATLENGQGNLVESYRLRRDILRGEMKGPVAPSFAMTPEVIEVLFATGDREGVEQSLRGIEDQLWRARTLLELARAGDPEIAAAARDLATRLVNLDVVAGSAAGIADPVWREMTLATLGALGRPDLLAGRPSPSTPRKSAGSAGRCRQVMAVTWRGDCSRTTGREH